MKWTPEKTQKLINMKKEKIPNSKIAEELGVSRNCVNVKIFYLDMCKKPPRIPSLPPQPDYATCELEPVKRAKEVFGKRMKCIKGQYFLDGHKILVGKLIETAKREVGEW